MGNLSLLSLNTFGIPFYLGWGRLRRLARELDRSPVEIICLQEIQQNSFAALIRRGLTSYPHAVYERHRYAPKGGLAIFSRLPYVDQGFDAYKDRGVWHSISLADWALYKGIQSVKFDVGGLCVIVLNTHMNANYSGVWHLSNRLTRILRSQVQQLSQAIHSFPEETLIIVCGDLNFPRTSFLYEELIAQNDLLDPLAEDERSTYRPFPLVPSIWKTSLDYMLIRRPARMNINVHADMLTIEDSKKKLSIQRFLTDHNALMLRLGWDAAVSS